MEESKASLIKSTLSDVLGFEPTEDELASLLKEMTSSESGTLFSIEPLILRVPSTISGYTEAYNRLENNANRDLRIIHDLHYFLLSYLGIAIMTPNEFGENKAALQLLRRILDQKINFSILSDLAKHYKNDTEMFNEVFGALVRGLKLYFGEKPDIKLLDAVFTLIDTALGEKAILDYLSEHMYSGDACADCLAYKILELGCDVPQVTQYLAAMDRLLLTANEMDGLFYFMRGPLEMLQSRFFSIQMQMLKGASSKDKARDHLLQFYANLANENMNRAKIHYEKDKVAPTQIVMNAFAIMLRFSEPFMGTNIAKMSLIDSKYYEMSDRLSLKDITSISHSQSDCEAGRANSSVSSTKPNFVTECFFLTVHLFRIGPLSLIMEYFENARDLQYLKDQLKIAEDQVGALPQGSPQYVMGQQYLGRIKAKIAEFMDAKVTLEVYLLDPNLARSSYDVVDLMFRWMLGLNGGFIKNVKDYNQSKLLVTNLSETVSKMPEFFIEIPSEFCLFISRVIPQFWTVQGKYIQPLVEFMLGVIACPDIRNPFVKSKFVEILYLLTDERLDFVFDDYVEIEACLMPLLVSFYIDVEKTGASTQFYDKFNIRYQISIIFRTAWQRHTILKNKLKAFSQDDPVIFVKFVNMLLNDMTYLLDESMSKLMEIHRLHLELSGEKTNALSAKDKEEKSKELQQNERICKTYMQLANESVNMMCYLTKEIVHPFLRPEIADRFASMLNFFITQLVGPKCTNLKVKDAAEHLAFNPKQLLRTLVLVYLNFSDQPEFITSLARDERSYSRELFQKCVGILRRTAVLGDTQISKFEGMLVQADASIAQSRKDEEALGEVPEEFLDPLMCTIMEDPVILKTSNMTVDRATIVAHLLNDKTDPFNRAALCIEDLEPNEELKGRIRKYKERRT